MNIGTILIPNQTSKYFTKGKRYRVFSVDKYNNVEVYDDSGDEHYLTSEYYSVYFKQGEV